MMRNFLGVSHTLGSAGFVVGLGLSIMHRSKIRVSEELSGRGLDSAAVVRFPRQADGIRFYSEDLLSSDISVLAS
jgi:hypothetical protein